MKIHLIRHAHAIDGTPDERRPLSAKGKKQPRVMAQHFQATSGFAPAEIWHSPLVRAVQTAERVSAISQVERLRELPDLRPDDSPRRMAARLRSVRFSVAVVGHEPHLSALATLLLGGSPKAPLVALRKCAVLTLERHGRRFRIIALALPPRE